MFVKNSTSIFPLSLHLTQHDKNNENNTVILQGFFIVVIPHNSLQMAV